MIAKRAKMGRTLKGVVMKCTAEKSAEKRALRGVLGPQSAVVKLSKNSAGPTVGDCE